LIRGTKRVGVDPVIVGAFENVVRGQGKTVIPGDMTGRPSQEVVKGDIIVGRRD
jgi:hypothetical protein